MTLRVEVGTSIELYAEMGYAATVDTYQIEWQIGDPEGGKVVLADGEGQGRIHAFGETPWEVAILTEPEPCVQFWADETKVPLDAARGWAWQLGATGPATVQQYCGCMVSYYSDRLEIHLGDNGQDFQLLLRMA